MGIGREKMIMEYRSDSRQFYLQLCSRMVGTISRSVALLDQGRSQEARDLLAKTRAEIDALIEGPPGATLRLSDADR